MKNSENKSLSNFSEDKVENLEEVLGGGDITIAITISGVLDGVKHNTDIKLGKAALQ